MKKSLINSSKTKTSIIHQKNQMNSLTYNISDYTDIIRLTINEKLQKNKSKLGQYFSNESLSKLMASMMNYDDREIKILDPGAGIGSLFVACIDEIIRRGLKPKKISITSYEIDKFLYPYLHDSLEQCKALCEKNQIKFSYELIKKDFILDVVSKLNDKQEEFSHIIMNPPFKKLSNFSETYKILKNIGLHSPNLYTVFMTLSEKMLQKNGEMVIISPRSFCNGSYFTSFRKNFLNSVSLKRIHIFNSRKSSFQDDGILQENIIIHVIKISKPYQNILISSNSDPQDKNMIIKSVNSKSIVDPKDTQCFMHIIVDEIESQISNKIRQLKTTLDDLGIDVSTGKVVDFRIKEALMYKPKRKSVPLIRPFNLSTKFIRFPILGKKENYIEITKKSKNLLIKNGNYVLVKRFTTKEEEKRIVTSVWSQIDFDFLFIGFENRINYFHKNGNSLDLVIAKGLSLFLNSTIIDLYFRQFNGNTQVNANDLRYLKYPTYEQLKTLGDKLTKSDPSQKEIDDLIEKVLFDNRGRNDKMDPIATKQKISEAISILQMLGFPKKQQNDMSALTLLALLDLKPNDSWKTSKKYMISITPMMNFFEKNYGKKYAPNSHETVRHQTVHQFVDAGLVIENPDNPKRPTNSGKTVYEIDGKALKLVQSFNTSKWNSSLQKYNTTRIPLQQKYEDEREMKKIPLSFPSGE